MPIEPFEIIKLFAGIIILTIPGYLWSFIFSKELKRLERIGFGFILGISIMIITTFLLDIIMNITVTQNIIYVIYLAYLLPVVILYITSIIKFGFKFPKLDKIKKYKYLILISILIFSAFMAFLPHLDNNYYLPFHVDEWIHWSYSKSIIEVGSSTFTNPYTGNRIVGSLEMGFHFFTGSLSWLSNANFVTIFVLMPAIIAFFTSLLAFNIGNKQEKKYGLEAALLVSFIPTTCRFLGPSFYVAVTLGLLFLIFFIWLTSIKKLQAVLLFPFFIFIVFLIHPTTSLAVIIIAFFYSILTIINKEYKIGAIAGIMSLIPILFVFLFSSRWNASIMQALDAFLGGQYILMFDLPKIWVSFEHMSIIVWILFIIGIYLSFVRGGIIEKSISLSSLTYIVLIGAYGNFEYGSPVFYERAFLYLFLILCIVAGFALRQLVLITKENIYKLNLKNFKNIQSRFEIILPVIIAIILLITVIPAHMNIQYYKLIDEEDYNAFTWIEQNIDSYKDENHSKLKAIVNPFYASPFSAITRLNIISSTMHPLYGYKLHEEVNNFLNNQCKNTSFLDKYNISLIYSNKCKNDNLTMVYPKVYIYP